MSAASPDPYEMLGVAPSATDEQLRTAYRRLAQRHHPDHNHGSPESARRFAEVQEAYAHARLMRASAQAASAAPTESPSATTADPELEARLAAMERELAAARARREQATLAARREAERTARGAARRPTPAPDPDRPSDEELGYVTTDDSFSRILDDFADQVAGRFAEAHDASRSPGAPRRPRSASEWIDELGARLTGERRKGDR